MEFLLLIEDRRDEAPRADVGVAEMGEFAGWLASQGKLVMAAGPLLPEATGARVSVRDGRRIVHDGPFTESKEIACGYFVVSAASRDEAVELAARCPYARAGAVEVREAGTERGDGGPPRAPRFLLLLLEGEHPEARDGDAEYAAMVAYTDALKREGKYVECAGLPRQSKGARVEVRGGRPIVTDGPFVETKELVGGLVLVEAASRDEAIALAARCPHATWGRVEVRGVAPRGGEVS
jgi:hypothetical protein